MPAGPGRPKGLQNKVTVEIKDMLRAALDEAGGKDYLVRQAKVNPVSFNALISKLIPADINAKLTGTVNVTIKQYSPVKE